MSQKADIKPLSDKHVARCFARAAARDGVEFNPVRHHEELQRGTCCSLQVYEADVVKPA